MPSTSTKAIDAVIDTALSSARRQASENGVAYGLTQALALLRETHLHQGGYGVMRGLDDTLRATLADFRLRGTAGDHIAPTPKLTADAARATAIMRDAVGSSLMLNLFGPGNLFVQHAAKKLMQELIVSLGGAPDWAALEALMAQSIHEEDEDAYTPALAASTRIQ